jgi:hypothetical protein
MFNSDLSKWDVSKSTDFRSMFSGCFNFKSDLRKWRIEIKNVPAQYIVSVMHSNTDFEKNIMGMFFNINPENILLPRRL